VLVLAASDTDMFKARKERRREELKTIRDMEAAQRAAIELHATDTAQISEPTQHGQNLNPISTGTDFDYIYPSQISDSPAGIEHNRALLQPVG